MKRLIAASLASLILAPAAHAATPRSIAESYVQRRAADLNAYSTLLRVDRFRTRTRFAFYLRWRDERGRLCKFLSEPQITVHKDGRVYAYNLGSGNIFCQ